MMLTNFILSILKIKIFKLNMQIIALKIIFLSKQNQIEKNNSNNI